MEQIFKTVRRSLWERLFSRPWNPMDVTKEVRDWKAEFNRPRLQEKANPGPWPMHPLPTLRDEVDNSSMKSNIRRVVRTSSSHEPPKPLPRPRPAPVDPNSSSGE